MYIDRFIEGKYGSPVRLTKFELILVEQNQIVRPIGFF